MTYSLSENSVTQSLHTSLGANFILIGNLFGLTAAHSILITIAYAGVKEFWWDIKFETPETSGGYIGGSRDFGFYLIGAALGLGILWIKAHT